MKRIGIFDALLALGVAVVAFRLVSAGLPDEKPLPPPELRNGSLLRLPNVVFGHGKRNVIVFVDTECAVSRSEAPRYRPLAALVHTVPSADVVVVGPQEIRDLEKWLEIQNVRVDRIISLPRSKIFSAGVVGYPTVLIVDDKRQVTDIGVGALSDAAWSQLERRVLDDATVKPLVHRVAIDLSEEEWARNPGPGLQILDIRDRALFRSGHRAGARNIPFDEAATRVPLEFQLTQPVAIDCVVASDLTNCRTLGSALLRVGFPGVFVILPGRAR